MASPDLTAVLDFLRAAEKLKSTWRSAWTSDGHPESAAQHTWRLCLMAVVLAPEYPEVDVGRLLRMCVVHDLGEAIRGDVPAIEQVGRPDKAEDERKDLLELLRPLPEARRADILELWDEYEAAATPEAKLAKGLDKLETILQHNQGANPPDFDYRFNLGYGRRFTDGDPLLAALRAELDRDTERRARERGT